MTDHPLLEELGQAHAAYETAAMAAATARAAVAIADMRLLRAEHDAANVRAAIAAASISPPSAWQPIETAPTDGTRVVVYIEASDELKAFQTIMAYRTSCGGFLLGLRIATHWQPEQPPP